MSKTTYDDLVGLAEAELDLNDRAIGSEVGYILDAARINADDTMTEDQTADYNYIALATVESQLCYHKDEAVKAWFIGHGVKF